MQRRQRRKIEMRTRNKSLGYQRGSDILDIKKKISSIQANLHSRGASNNSSGFSERGFPPMQSERCLIFVSLVITFCIPCFAADSPITPPDGFSFTGAWNCSGSFPQSGKVHRSAYVGKSVAGDDWIELVETDIEPKGYVGHYLIGYDASKKQIVELDANNAGYAIYASPGWQDRSLILTGTETVSYLAPKNRFVFEVKAADAFDVTWETNGGSGWVASDRLNCQRAGDADELPSSVYLQPHVQPGQKISNVFSRAVAYKAAGVDDVVRRVSGTAEYVVSQSSPEEIVVDGTFVYDGKPEAKGKTEFKDQGRVSCWEGKCATATDASGLLYNAGIWGVAPNSLRKGKRWEVVIAEPWELGPAGKETVTVLAVDATEHSVTLQREGSGEGFFDNDAKQVHLTKDGKSYIADVSPGRSRWKGYTTFREGIVMSDELLVERPVTLSSKELGSLAGTERQYILLNAMPIAEPNL
jgi:hypothetical protein